ncbi:MAG: DUF4136 domain-containing protein [Bryobacterales bacterium]|nr:DUF4136 domain-containing protein [Bryobacterales bacterium]
MNSLRLAAAALLFAAALVAGEVKSYPKPDVDFTQFKTYEWVAPRVLTRSGILEDDPDFAPLIRKAINKQLSAKGLQEVKTGGDLRVQAGGIGQASSQVDALIFSGFDFYWGYGPVNVTPISRVNKEGLLAVSLIDLKTKKPVWSGYAVEGLAMRGNVEATIDKAAERLFKKFPPKPKK